MVPSSRAAAEGELLHVSSGHFRGGVLDDGAVPVPADIPGAVGGGLAVQADIDPGEPDGRRELSD